ncbi:alpha/beta family hydrolase, partial [Alcanivorax sp. HI0083]
MAERFGVDCLYDRAEKPVAVLLLAHGAGAAMDSDFMNTMAAALASHSVAVLRFEFPYMQRRREEQRQFPPDRAPKLLAAFAERVR